MPPITCELGVETVRARQLQAKGGNGAAASAYVTDGSSQRLAHRAWRPCCCDAGSASHQGQGGPARRSAERAADAEELHRTLSWALPRSACGWASQLPDRERQAALDGRSGDSPVLVSVKSLIEESMCQTPRSACRLRRAQAFVSGFSRLAGCSGVASMRPLEKSAPRCTCSTWPTRSMK